MVATGGTKGRTSQGRRRRELSFIVDPAKRLVTFSKYKSAIFKKASELSLLDGARVAAVVFSATGRTFAVGAPSVDRILRPLPGGGIPEDAVTDSDREALEATARRAKEARAQKARMVAVGKNVLLAAAAGGARFWWEADVEALGGEELREFTRPLRRLRDNVQRRADKLPLALASQPTTRLRLQ